jgi:hypothetical protein
MNFCTQCRSPLVGAESVTFPVAPKLPGAFGRNHDVFASALAGHAGEILSVHELRALVQKYDASFNMGSFLPNDHGEGNLGACGCSKAKGGTTPIFEKIGSARSGRYRVIDYAKDSPNGQPNGVTSTTNLNVPEVPEMASTWLLSDAVTRTNRQLGYDNPTEALVGQKRGQWVAVGRRLPPHDLTRGYQTTWALGLDRGSERTLDYELGTKPVHPLYIGLRCERNVSGPDGRKIYSAFKEVLPGSWKEPSMYWPIYVEPDVESSGRLLTANEYTDLIISKYVETYGIVLGFLKSR